MDRLKRYFDIYVPTEKCNLTCSYCYVSQEGNASGKIAPIGHTPKQVRSALSQKRLGGICLMNFCAGGETLLGEEILPIVRELLEEGHYIQIVTNGTITRRFVEISKWDSGLLAHLFIKFSFHYMELKTRNCMEIFFHNVQLMRRKGCSISLELMPHDELLPYTDDIKSICLENVGALPQLTVGRNNNTEELELLSAFTKEEYESAWSDFDSEMFRFKMSMFGKAQKQFCYAGEWSCSLRVDTGDMCQCNGLIYLDNIYDNIDEGLHFKPVGNACPYPYCWNCHAYLCLGVVPDIAAPTYAVMRDRQCTDGSRWLTSNFYDIVSQKLSDNNTEYTANDKERINNSDFIKMNGKQTTFGRQQEGESVVYDENVHEQIVRSEHKNWKQRLIGILKH